jgi:hypothetical protein
MIKTAFSKREEPFFVVFLQKNRFATVFGIILAHCGKIEAKAKIGGCKNGNCQEEWRYERIYLCHCG